MGKVFVVFCIDTEGPCFDPNYPNHSELLGTWKAIDKIFLSQIFSQDFRYAFPDSQNNPLVFTWFIINWVGFRTNPVRRDFGYHKILDHYQKSWGSKLKEYHDEIGWHYHHPSLSGAGNHWGLNWFSNHQYEEILCRLIIDRNLFPIVCRAGGTIEDNIQSQWLEQWIPFDFSNRNTSDINWAKKEPDGKQIRELVDWGHAPDDWLPYHPSAGDFSKTGQMKRTIFRCLDIKSRVYTLKRKEIEKAFLRAKNGQDTILSMFDHDFRNRSEVIYKIMKQISQLAKESGVKFYYGGARQAVKSFYRYSLKNDLKLTIKNTRGKLIVLSNKTLFNPQPFLAVKYSQNLYCWLPMFKTRDHAWEYYFIPEDEGKKMAIGAHDLEGNTITKRFFIKK
jgi:hypothetical protein